MTDAGLWHATTTRDANADGLFVYAVTSTGIYCRPSCPSRKPRIDRVRFFPAPAMAEANGFRACLRCRPKDEIAGTTASTRVRRACQAMAARPDAPWTSDRLARAGQTTVAQLQRAFRTLLGLSPRDYLAACRHRRFLQTLRDGARVTDAIYSAGYGSPSRVYGPMRLPGMTPATYGRGGAGASIHWSTSSSRIGRILVAATDKGLCFVEVGSTTQALVAGLANEFPKAAIDRRPSATLAPLMTAARAVADGQPVTTQLPVDIRGTAFQWRVWRALTEIPAGVTRSYTDVAAAIGQPGSVRAVARACATNPIALLVPCHRVISRAGGVSGYRWGAERKKKLLERESRSPRPAR